MPLPAGEHEIWDGQVIAAARALAGLTVRELAHRAKTNKAVISGLERRIVIVTPTRKHGATSKDLWDRIIFVLLESGVELVREGSSRGSGVRWSLPRSARGTLQSSG